MLTKRKLKRWHDEALHAYAAGWNEALWDRAPVELANSQSAIAALRRGREDALACKQSGKGCFSYRRLPLDLWAEIVARKLKPVKENEQ